MAVRSTSGHSRESGFTLIEVLAALAITSVIIMSTAALMWNVTLFFDHGARSVSEADRLVLAEDRLAADFSGARFAQRLTASGGATAAFIGQPASTFRLWRCRFHKSSGRGSGCAQCRTFGRYYTARSPSGSLARPPNAARGYCGQRSCRPD